jgi:hypothetical protein
VFRIIELNLFVMPHHSTSLNFQIHQTPLHRSRQARPPRVRQSAAEVGGDGGGVASTGNRFRD